MDWEKLKKRVTNIFTPSPAPVPAGAVAEAGVPNSSQSGNSPSSPGFSEKLKARLGLGENQPTAVRQMNDWVGERLGDKLDYADEFIHKNTFGGQSKLFNAGLAVYDKINDWKDDFHDFSFSDWYHNTKFGKAMDGVKGWIGDKAHRAGAWIKSKLPQKEEKPEENKEPGKLAKAGEWIKGKAKSAGNWIKDKFSKDKEEEPENKEPGKLAKAGAWIKDKYNGSFLQKGVNAVGSGLSTAGHWIKDKAVAAGEWAKDKYKGSKLQKGVNWAKANVNDAIDIFHDKKERLMSYKDNFMDQLAAHDDERYEQHRAKKYGEEYIKQKLAYEMMLKNGEFAENTQELSNFDELLGPENDARDDLKSNLEDSVPGYVTSGASLAAGQLEKLATGDNNKILSTGVKAVGKAVSAGIKGKQLYNVSHLDDKQLSGNNDKDTAKLMRGREAISGNLKRGIVKDSMGAVGNAAKSAGAFAEAVGIVPGAKYIGKAVNTATNIGSSVITGKMKKSQNKKLAKESVFGSQEKYKDVKSQFDLLRSRDMKSGMSRATNARNINDIADRARYDSANTAMKYMGKGQAGYNLMKAKGYSDKDIENMNAETIARDMGVTNSKRQMRKRKWQNTWQKQYF